MKNAAFARKAFGFPSRAYPFLLGQAIVTISRCFTLQEPNRFIVCLDAARHMPSRVPRHAVAA